MKGSLPILILLCSATVSFGWDLKPDPPADKPWALKADLSVPLAERNDRIAFADAAGPFVLTGIGAGSAREVFDLRTGESVAKFDAGEGRRITDQEYLSPDGKTWAFPVSLGKEAKLIDTASGKALPAITAAGTVQSAGFIAPDRLLVIALKERERVAQVFDSTTGKEVVNWPLDVGGFVIPNGQTRPFAISPGGKYAAVVGRKGVAVFTVTDGKKLADLDLPAVATLPSNAPPPVGVAFAADGSELASVVGKSEKGSGTLKVWKLSDGTTVEHTIDRPDTLAGTTATSIAPILSGGWLIDGTQVWANGKVQRTVPKGTALYIPRVAVTPEQVIGVIEPNARTIQKKPAVGVIGGSVAAGGALKDGTLTGATEVPTGEQRRWNGAVAKYALAVTPAPRKLMMLNKGVVGLTVSLDGKRYFVETDFSPRVDLARRTVQSADFQANAGVMFDLPDKRVLFGDTATGEAFLTIGAPDPGGNGERLELLAATGKSVVAWRPHPEVKPDPTRSSIRYGIALSASRAITVGNERVTLWQLPEAKGVWTTSIPDANGSGLSPDGKVLFVAHAGGVRALNVDSGVTLGNLQDDPIKHRGDERTMVAVSGDGKRLATLSGPPTSRVLRVWELSEGSLLCRLNLPFGGDAPTLRFFGSRFLLAGELVYDLTDRREVWKVKPPQLGVVANAAPADGRLWFVSVVGGTADLHAAEFPADQMASFITTYDATGDGVFQKGEKVRVIVEPPADAPPGWDAQARTFARLGVNSAKLTEDAKTTTVVTVKFSKVPDTPVKLKWQGAENLGKEETINRFALEARAEVTRDGQVVYTAPPFRTAMRIKEWPQVNEITDDSKSGQEFFTKQVWQQAAFSAGSVFASSGAGVKQPNGQMWRLPGEATLTKDGLNMNWPVGHQPVVGMAVDGNPSLAPAPTSPGAVGATAWILWVVGGGCGGLLLAAGTVVLVVILAAKRRKNLDDEQRWKKTRSDDEGDRPKRRR